MNQPPLPEQMVDQHRSSYISTGLSRTEIQHWKWRFAENSRSQLGSQNWRIGNAKLQSYANTKLTRTHVSAARALEITTTAKKIHRNNTSPHCTAILMNSFGLTEQYNALVDYTIISFTIYEAKLRLSFFIKKGAKSMSKWKYSQAKQPRISAYRLSSHMISNPQKTFLLLWKIIISFHNI